MPLRPARRSGDRSSAGHARLNGPLPALLRYARGLHRRPPTALHRLPGQPGITGPVVASSREYDGAGHTGPC